MSDIEQTPEVIEPLFKTPSILDKIPEIRFSKVTNDKSNLEYEHDEHIFVYYKSDSEDQSHLEKVETIKQYISGLAHKLLEESKNIYPVIDALPTFIDNVVNHSNSIIDAVVSGSEKYSPYINDLEEDGITIKNKPVIMTVKIGITKTNPKSPVPMLIWVVTSHSWKANETDPNNFDLINTIELFSE